MDARAAKLALARKKLKDHQEKKVVLKESCTNEDEAQETDIKREHNIDKKKPSHINQNQNNNSKPITPEVNVTELLVSSKRNLELKINELQQKISQLECDYTEAVNNYTLSKQQNNNLDKNLKNLNSKFIIASDELHSKDKVIKNLNMIKMTLSEENNNLQDQLEFTKNVLTAKETENDSLHIQLSKVQNQLDATQLQLQQITNGSANSVTPSGDSQDGNIIETLQQKILTLEQQLKILQKERDQINSHYEHYVSELNNQLRSVAAKNEELSREVQSLTNRENSLIDQIGDMEIRLQNYHKFKEAVETKQSDENVIELQQNYMKSMEMLTELNHKYEEIQRLYEESEAKVIELSQRKESESTQDEISITKLSADITSDKIAAQRATEQNIKLKTNVQDLEEAFVKLSQDKLELVEKITAEKYLNRELTIKLAEIAENAKDMHIKLMAKDEEMIRLQNNLREAEKQLEHLPVSFSFAKDNDMSINPRDSEHLINCYHENNVDVTCTNNIEEDIQNNELNPDKNVCEKHHDSTIPKEHAMLKLQERFLKIMEECADLSDEKHRLEHLVLQLQNETDTICEYVALYQQQRSLLKKRDEERSAQIKIFQDECDRLRKQFEELGAILLRFAGDAKLSAYFQDAAKQADMTKVMNLLNDLKQNSLIDPKKISFDLNNFYPCSCCSGQLIDV